MNLGPADHICTALQFLFRTGLLDYNGHASLRTDTGFLINSGVCNTAAPSVADISHFALDGALISGPKPPNELHLHAAIYQARADVHAVVHSHPKWICTQTSAGRALEPVMPQAALVDALPCYSHAHSISTASRGADVASLMGHARGLWLMGHGIVMTGPDLQTACVTALYAEQTAERMVHAALLGGALPLTDAERSEYAKSLENPGLFAKCWDFHLTGQKE